MLRSSADVTHQSCRPKIMLGGNFMKPIVVLSSYATVFGLLFCVAIRTEAGIIDTGGTINPATNEIFVFGTITSNDSQIDVNLTADTGDIPVGSWSLEKSETNDTSDSWFGWEISLPSANTIADLSGTFSSNLFSQVAVFSDRIVFFDGEVQPGETLQKFFELEQLLAGVMSMSHNRIITTPTLAQINDGFPALPSSETHNITLQTVPEPSTWLLFVVGIGGVLGFLRRKKA